MNKKFLLLVANLCLFATLSNAQITFLKGHAVLKDGTKINGQIGKFESEPWFNQRYILFKDSAELAANPNAKSKKYKVDELETYQVGETIYDKIHYVNTEKLQLKSFGTNDHMLPRLAKGRMNAHQFYSYPDDVSAFWGTEEEYKEWKKGKQDELLTGYKILITKDQDTKVKDAFDADLLKYFEDTPEVFQKYQAGGYGNEPVTKKKGLAAKMIAMAKKVAFKPQEAEAIALAINDYNAKNTK